MKISRLRQFFVTLAETLVYQCCKESKDQSRVRVSSPGSLSCHFSRPAVLGPDDVRAASSGRLLEAQASPIVTAVQPIIDQFTSSG